ncbi:MAG: alpha-1,2-fucosyltransferase [Chryseolinea sp.]
MLILIYKYGGRLGNRLFAFSHIIAFSRSFNIKVRYPAFDEYAKYFKGTAENLVCQYPEKRNSFTHKKLRFLFYVLNKLFVKPLRMTKFHSSPFHKVVYADTPEFSFTETRSFDMNDAAFVNLVRSGPLTFLIGRFFRDYKHLAVHQDAVREFFTPVESIQMKINEHFSSHVKDADIVIGVHRRGEDYREFVDGKYYFTQEQYHNKLTEIKHLFPDKSVCFIICSNDEVDLNVYVSVKAVKGPGSPIEDLYTLAKCDFIIAAPSTYSQWAAFYGNKPLCQLWTIDKTITLESFKTLPPEKLYNFSFN